MKNVFIVGLFNFHDFKTMYEGRGFNIVDSVEKADIVQFTGGEDVSPALYGEHTHVTTGKNHQRDMEEIQTYQQAKHLGKFIVGVCRGSQFLCVMNGGKLYQHVTGHAVWGGHNAVDVETGKIIPVTSTHHQMMKPPKGAIVVALAETMLSLVKYCMTHIDTKPMEIPCIGHKDEVESCYFPDTKTLCFQPHPEYVSKEHACQEYFFSLLERWYE